MGDKVGKKDKEKNRQQQVTKHKQAEQKKHEKAQPKSTGVLNSIGTGRTGA